MIIGKHPYPLSFDSFFPPSPSFFLSSFFIIIVFSFLLFSLLLLSPWICIGAIIISQQVSQSVSQLAWVINRWSPGGTRPGAVRERRNRKKEGDGNEVRWRKGEKSYTLCLCSFSFVHEDGGREGGGVAFVGVVGGCLLVCLLISLTRVS